jgi:hypothetical protein
METTYRLDTSELGSDFINSLRSAYPDQKIVITVREQDATEYLLSTSANRERMERVLKETEKEELISFETLEQAMQAAKP